MMQWHLPNTVNHVLVPKKQRDAAPGKAKTGKMAVVVE
jgi:hypothetical protein